LIQIKGGSCQAQNHGGDGLPGVLDPVDANHSRRTL
jgi:hypothetical protein